MYPYLLQHTHAHNSHAHNSHAVPPGASFFDAEYSSLDEFSDLGSAPGLAGAAYPATALPPPRYPGVVREQPRIAEESMPVGRVTTSSRYGRPPRAPVATGPVGTVADSRAYGLQGEPVTMVENDRYPYEEESVASRETLLSDEWRNPNVMGRTARSY
eukprot:m.121319 g.121319  ORF g.121319 m.121319 type:complete len:158 (-) comp14573_c1_seq6:204-677(-)